MKEVNKNRLTFLLNKISKQTLKKDRPTTIENKNISNYLAHALFLGKDMGYPQNLDGIETYYEAQKICKHT